ncbi:MAG: FHA domain-containing protein [Raineya sp.]|nr:FHA domain-containing protein [Raineya sp.]
MQKFVCIFLFLGVFVSLKAQNVSVDNSAFPSVAVSITSEKPLKEADVKILQAGKEIPFQWKNPEKTASKGAKSVYFLVETSGFTAAGVVNNCKKGVSDFIKNAPEGTLFNVSSFWKANAESKILNNLSADFTANKQAIIEEINQKIKPVTDTQQQADLHKAIYDAIDYVSKTATTPQKQIVVLTAGVNKSYSPIRIDDCIDKANQSNVQVFSLVYKTGFTYALDNLKKLADKTSAKSNLVSSASEITENLQDFFQTEAPVSTGSQTYQVTFTLPNPEDTNNLEISIAGQKQVLAVSKPAPKNQDGEKAQTESKPNNSLLYIGIAVAVLGIAGYFFYDKQQKAKKLQEEKERAAKAEMERQQQIFQQEQQRLQQQQMQQQQFYAQSTTVNEPQKFDPKKTMIGGGGGTPKLNVVGENFRQTFMLHKTTMTIGRKEDNDIVIPIQTVSGKHAILTNEGGNWFIADNNSTNGVILNGNRVQKHILKNGDEIQLGGALMIFQV